MRASITAIKLGKTMRIQPRRGVRSVAPGAAQRNPGAYDVRNLAGKGWIPPPVPLCRSPPTAWQVSGFPLRSSSYGGQVAGAREGRGSPLAAVFHGCFTPGSALLHPGLRSGHPSGVGITGIPAVFHGSASRRWWREGGNARCTGISCSRKGSSTRCRGIARSGK